MLICCAEWFATREMSRTLASVSAFQTTGMMVMFLVVVRFVCSAGVDDVLFGGGYDLGGGGWAMEGGRGLQVF
jgi:hypothetical protein